MYTFRLYTCIPRANGICQSRFFAPFAECNWPIPMKFFSKVNLSPLLSLFTATLDRLASTWARPSAQIYNPRGRSVGWSVCIRKCIENAPHNSCFLYVNRMAEMTVASCLSTRFGSKCLRWFWLLGYFSILMPIIRPLQMSPFITYGLY